MTNKHSEMDTVVKKILPYLRHRGYDVEKDLVLESKDAPTIASLNRIDTQRGKSPDSDAYVDEKDGYALVIKAGSISRYGTLLELEEADYIEKDVYDLLVVAHVQQGDILLASTGEGTLGKCCVCPLDRPAIADGHVTIIRVNPDEIYPEYLCDYLRLGFGAKQIQRFYTGSTGLIELTPDQVNRTLVETLGGDLEKQKEVSRRLREAETAYQEHIMTAEQELEASRTEFSAIHIPVHDQS